MSKRIRIGMTTISALLVGLVILSQWRCIDLYVWHTTLFVYPHGVWFSPWKKNNFGMQVVFHDLALFISYSYFKVPEIRNTYGFLAVYFPWWLILSIWA